jgi:mannosyltransferase
VPLNAGAILNRLKTREAVLLILCVLIGFGLRVYTFDQKSLWIDEIFSLNDSRDGVRGQIEYYRQHPNYPQAPLFFLFTHLFYPFSHAERDLRILPVIFGSLSIPMFYFLAQLFSPGLALPCTLSLSFMLYHISLSQDARSYALLMFFAMAGLYCLMKSLQTSRTRHIIFGAFFYALLFYLSYSSIPFMIFSQVLWFYRSKSDTEKRDLSITPVLLFNGLILLFCLPWILFLGFNYRGQNAGQWITGPFDNRPTSFWEILYGLFHDWVPFAPLMVSSAFFLLIAPAISKERRNRLVLGATILLPIFSLYGFVKFTNFSHFFVSRYFICLLPLFFITLYQSIHDTELKLTHLRRWVSLKMLFLFLFIATNLVMLPLYYRSEKQDFRGLTNYLKASLRKGDRIFDVDGRLLGILHYFGVPPGGRYYHVDYWRSSGPETEYRKSFVYRNNTFTIYHARTCCDQYLEDGHRLWIVAGLRSAEKIKQNTPSVLKGYFDGSFFHGIRFPTDASMCLFLWDLGSPKERGIDIPAEVK